MIKKKVLAWSLGTNQALGIHIVRRIDQIILGFYDLEPWLEFIMCWNNCSKSNAQDGYAKMDETSLLPPSSVGVCKKWHLVWIGPQVFWIQFSFDLELIWMPYYQRWCTMMIID
jgi:hypothetical protein